MLIITFSASDDGASNTMLSAYPNAPYVITRGLELMSSEYILKSPHISDIYNLQNGGGGGYQH